MADLLDLSRRVRPELVDSRLLLPGLSDSSMTPLGRMCSPGRGGMNGITEGAEGPAGATELGL